MTRGGADANDARERDGGDDDDPSNARRRRAGVVVGENGDGWARGGPREATVERDDADEDDEDDGAGWKRNAVGTRGARVRDAGFRGDGERTIEKVLHGGREGRRGEDVALVVVGGEVCGGGTSHVGRVHGSRALVERFFGAKRARGDAGGGERHERDVVRAGD